MQRMLDALHAAALARSKAGARHVLGVPAVRALTADARILEIAKQYLGPYAIPFRATLFDKSPANNWLVTWHQDLALPLCERSADPAWGPWSIKAGVLHAHAPAEALERIVALRVHLDASTPENGPLRVLPGSHARGVLTQDEILALAASLKPVECVTPSGGVVALRPLTVHASSKLLGSQPRRVLHIEYADSLELAPDIRLAVD